MINSDALKRVKNHTHSSGPRMEGLFLSLDHLRDLVTFLETDATAISQGIDHVSFMIGKKNSGTGRPLIMTPPSRRTATEYTVEVLPFKAVTNSSGIITNGSFMSGHKLGVADEILGFLEIPGLPFDNMSGGGGGNQKTPPPSTP